MCALPFGSQVKEQESLRLFAVLSLNKVIEGTKEKSDCYSAPFTSPVKRSGSWWECLLSLQSVAVAFFYKEQRLFVVQTPVSATQ